MTHLKTENTSADLRKAVINPASKTWLINPWHCISLLKMHFIASYVKPHKVFQKLCLPSFVKLCSNEIIKTDNLRGTKFHLKYLMRFEFANSEFQTRNSNTKSSELSEELILRPAIIKTNKKISFLEKGQLTKNNSTNANVISHYNKKSKSEMVPRRRSIIFHMRNFNNWIKNMLISEYIQKIKGNQQSGDHLRVLDMCCGKGGDLPKYFQNQISHLICTDIAKRSLQKCISRYLRFKDDTRSHFSAEFFACDCSKDRLKKYYKSPWLEHHLVSCQFALHYSFGSYQQADCIISNASECLQAGGFFIATIPNAYEIMRRLRKSKDGRSFGNELYNIEFLCDTKRPPLFGAEYRFQLEDIIDCSEFLIHFPTLVKLCRKNGLKLDKVNTFAEYFDASYQRGSELLRKNKCLQTVFYESDLKIQKEFEHVENFTNKVQSTSDSYGTLSKPEWEVTTLYLVCAFKKCKNTWDSEFNPIYEFDG